MYYKDPIVKEDSSSSEESFRELVPTKRPTRIPLTVKEKTMVVNAYKYLEDSSQNEKDKTWLYLETADMLGIQPASVYRTLREHSRNEIKAALDTKKRPPCYEKITESEESALRKLVYSFFENDQLPTEKKILRAVNDDHALPTFRKTTFHQIMKHLRFKNLTIAGTDAVIDEDDVTIWRRKYINKMMQYRKEKRRIFYVDEAWVHVEGLRRSQTPSSICTKGNDRLNIVHIGNENGFLPDAVEIFDPYYISLKDPMTAAEFETWFENIVKKLGENAVVVLDDAPYHSRKIWKTPTNTWTKSSIQEWLIRRDIEFTDGDVKAELLDKVDKLHLDKHTYALDEIANKHKVEVLRIPPFHYHLNPMFSVLSEITERVKKNRFPTLDKAYYCLKRCIDKFPAHKWAHYVERAIEEESYFYKIDDVIDNLVDKYRAWNLELDTSDDDWGANFEDNYCFP